MLKLKKLFAGLLSAALLCTCLAAPISAAEPTYAPGDVNMDGKVNATDAVLVLFQYTAQMAGLSDEQILERGRTPFTEEQNRLADVCPKVDNQGRTVNAADACMILGYYAYITLAGNTCTMEELVKTLAQ